MDGQKERDRERERDGERDGERARERERDSHFGSSLPTALSGAIGSGASTGGFSEVPRWGEIRFLGGGLESSVRNICQPKPGLAGVKATPCVCR